MDLALPGKPLGYVGPCEALIRAKVASILRPLRALKSVKGLMRPLRALQDPEGLSRPLRPL